MHSHFPFKILVFGFKLKCSHLVLCFTDFTNLVTSYLFYDNLTRHFPPSATKDKRLTRGPLWCVGTDNSTWLVHFYCGAHLNKTIVLAQNITFVFVHFLGSHTVVAWPSLFCLVSLRRQYTQVGLARRRQVALEETQEVGRTLTLFSHLDAPSDWTRHCKSKAQEHEENRRRNVRWQPAGVSVQRLALWPRSKEVPGSSPARRPGPFVCGVCMSFENLLSSVFVGHCHCFWCS